MSCLCLVAAACDKTGNDAGPAPLENTVHLMVEGEPFLMLGAQLRTDYFIQLDGKSYDELDPYFELAAKCWHPDNEFDWINIVCYDNKLCLL